MASLTKMMTAAIIFDLAQADPQVMEETVTISRAAAAMGGTSAKLQAADRVSVAQLLYGLLLPSGNDASVALAEHFGPRLSLPKGRAEAAGSAQERFVAEMNQRARRLGLRQTNFENPHGFSLHELHRSSARDMAQLAIICLQFPQFRQYVGTREHTATIQGAKGSRTVHWTNTNELLGLEGFHGVKTGTNDAAGACLVASFRDGETDLIVSILGARSDKDRYDDVLKLVAWARHTLGPAEAVRQPNSLSQSLQPKIEPDLANPAAGRPINSQ
jgi:D-alanyl-D-alanine carboxypeptidase (penicillin-binding protein 5/6)